MEEEAPFGSSVRWAWARAVPSASSLPGVFILSVALAAGGAVASLVFPSSSLLIAIVRAVLGVLVGLTVGLALLFAWCVLRAPYQQLDVIRRMAEMRGGSDTAKEELAWLQATPVCVYDQGRTVTLADVCLALDDAGLALWRKDMHLLMALEWAFPHLPGEGGASGAGGALYDLVGHDLVEESRVNALDHESSTGGGILSATVITNASTGTRAVDRSYSQFRWTAYGRHVVRLLRESQPKSATIPSTDQT